MSKVLQFPNKSKTQPAPEGVVSFQELKSRIDHLYILLNGPVTNNPSYMSAINIALKDLVKRLTQNSNGG